MTLTLPAEGTKCIVCAAERWPFPMGPTEVLWVTLPGNIAPWWYRPEPDSRTMELHHLGWKPTHWRKADD